MEKSFDEVIISSIKELLVFIWTIVSIYFEAVFNSLKVNPFLYVISFYFGFLIGWYIFGYFFDKLKTKFSYWSIPIDIFVFYLFGLIFSFSGFLTGFLWSLIVMDIVKFIFSKIGLDYSKLTVKKMAVYLLIVPLILKIILEPKREKQLLKERQQQEQERMARLIEEKFIKPLEKVDEEIKEERRQKEEVDKVIDDKIENLLKKLDNF